MKQIPKQIIALVVAEKILLSGKARNQDDSGRFDVDDLIHSILHGKLVKKEKDERKVSKYKYTIVGSAVSGEQIYSCGKIIQTEDGLYFVLTFHEER